MTVDEAMNVAIAHHQAGRLAEAEGIYRQVLGAVPGHAGALQLLGVLAHQVGRGGVAEELIRKSIEIAPSAAAYSNLGEVLRERGKVEEAVGAYREAIRLEPGMGTAYSNLGMALQRLRRFGEAEAALREAVRLDPGGAAGWQNLCNTLGDVGKTADAVEAGRRAVALNGGSASAWSDLGVACVENGELRGAEEAFERAVAIEPGWADVHHNLAQVLLRMGEFERGWEEYEWRWGCKDFPSPAREFGRPTWRGQDLGGKTILLHAEQGLGDAMMFARYVPMVAARGAKKVVVECQGELVGLMRSVGEAGEAMSHGGNEAMTVEVIARGEGLPEFDYQCPFLSLPRAFGTRVEAVPARVPYLRADVGRVERWRTSSQLSLPGSQLKVGIVWAGRPAHQNDHNRSTSVEPFARLAMDGVRLFSLQVGERAGDARRVEGIVDLSAELRDYMDTAAMIENLDLVISVDTSVVHCAGALGKEVWVLLPFAGDWRWMGRREDSPWYPTLRLFRQERWGDWGGVFQRVKGELVRRRMQADG